MNLKRQLKYIELKTGFTDNGPAWIAMTQTDEKSHTILFNGRSFKGDGQGPARDLETDEIYWISGIEQNGHDRHWARKEKIMIDRKVIGAYLQIMDEISLDTAKFIVVDLDEDHVAGIQ